MDPRRVTTNARIIPNGVKNYFVLSTALTQINSLSGLDAA
jgi:hypothetical protein